MADGSLPIVVTPEAFGRGAFDLKVVEGLTVRAMLVEAVKAGLPAEALSRTEIYVDGARLDRDTALDHVLTADQVVNVVVEPRGGGGGSRKDIGQILLTVAVIAVSAWVGGGAATPAGFFDKLLVRTALAGAVGLAGQALIGALYGPNGGAAKANDRYALQSASNQYRQWGPMPLALGEVVAAPDLAVKTFTQSQGEDVWMYGILGVHYGPCEVSEIKIGDTLASTMGPGDFRMVQHLAPGPRTFQLYPNDVDQLDLNEELQATPSSATPIVRAASSDGSRFDFDFFMPGGLHFQKDDGRLLSAHVSVAIQCRPIDQNGAPTGSWQPVPGFVRGGATKDPLRETHSVHLPEGRYEFELVRNRPDDDNDKRRDQIVLTAIKAVAFRKPVVDETLSLIEFAVRATAINQGGLAPITCRIKPLCPTWTGSGWGPPVATSNPAALARWLLTGSAPAKRLTSAQADARLRAWSGLCDEYDWTCHVYLTEARTQAEALQILERAGRASLFWDGTQVAAAPWVEKPAPRQLFTGANLKDHRWEIIYPEPVHALRVEFQNFDKGGEPDELFVYADGYGEVADPFLGIEAATLVEALRLDGQAKPERAYRDGRWALGQRKLQRRVDTWTADVEHLVSQYGDRVRLAWNRVNGGDARVRCRRWSGALVSGLRLSQSVEMVAGVEYAVDLRTKAGLFTAVPIETRPGVSREIVFAAPRSPGVCPASGDLIAFGEAERVSEDVELVGIEPGENLTAVLTGVRYVAPELMAGETGPIPPLRSRLSGDRQANPPRPTLLGVQADAHGVRISFAMPTWRGAPLSGFSVRWRSRGPDGQIGTWAALPALDAGAREVRTPPLREAPGEGADATRADVEIVATTVDGRASKPLVLTVALPVPSQPENWTVEPKPPAADGSSQPILVVTGAVDDPAVAAVKIAWGLTPEGPWKDVYQGAPSIKGLEITGLTAGVEHYVAITYLSAQGVPGEFLVIGPRVPGEMVAGGLTPGAAQEIVRDVLGQVGDIAAGTEAAEQVAELVLETILNENDALMKEAKERGEGIAIAYQGATQYADGKIAEATYTMATIAMLDAAQAATLIQSQSYTDGTVATALNTVYTKAQVDSGLSTTLQQAKSYSDAQASEASLLYATKAERESGDAATYASMQSYVDAYKAEASVLFAAQSSLNGVSATAALALETAQNATTKLNEARAVLIAAADGSRPALVALVSGPGGADAMLSADRIWFGPNTVIDTVTNIRRTTVGAVRYVEAWGAPFGSDSLTYWHGLNSVPIGSERKDNAISWEDSSGAGLYGGETLTNPFDSGASGGIIHLTGSFQNIAEASKYTRQGRFLLWPEFYHQGAGTPNGEGYAEYAVEWQIVSANAAGGDVQVLKSGPEVGQGGFGPSSWGPMLFAPPSDFIGIAHSKTGQRRIILQARLARGDIASLTNYAVKGFYAV